MQKKGQKKKRLNRLKPTIFLKKNRKGLSTIVITLIIILISLVAVGIIWVVVRNVIQSGTEGIALGQFTLGADIINVNVDNSSNNVSLSVKRSSGEGEITGIKFIFSDDTDSEIITEKISMGKLEEKRFTFHLAKLTVSKLISISIVPVLASSSGKETLGSVLSKYNVQEGTTTSGSGASCVANCTGKVCGNDGCGGSCGTCTTGTCNSTGSCVAGSCNPGVCGVAGAMCGVVANGTCGTMNCGNCSGGYNCVGGSCVQQLGYTCGNNILEQGEVCDGTSMSGYTCSSVAAGFVSGTLSCSSDCRRYITTSCVAGNTINALNCSQTDVQNAINSAIDGSTVNVPAGNCIWNVVNCYPDSNECSAVRINKSIFLKGAGIGKTNITNRIPSTWNNLALFIKSQLGKPIRINGFTFIEEDYTHSTFVGFGGTSKNLRIDNCKFERGISGVSFSGYVEGVIDHCTFINPNIGIRINGDNNAAWTRSIVTGTGNAFFVEDNNFTLDANFGTGSSNEMVYPQDGARPVVRYNNYNATTYTRDDTPMLCSTHGNWGGTPPYYSDYRGQPIYEIYNNKVSINRSYNLMIGGNFRGSSQLAYNNVIIKLNPSGSEYISGLTEEEGWTSGGLWCPACPQLTAGPANDQVVNTFFWNNTINGVQNNNVRLPFTSTNGYGYDNIIIQQNRDYYLHEPQSSGGKAYYVTNQNCTGIKTPAACCTGLGTGNCVIGHNDTLLYTASGANAYYPYVSYPYPHPLTLIS